MSVAELGYKIDSSGAVVASGDLDKMTSSAMKAEAQERKLSAATVELTKVSKTASSSYIAMAAAEDDAFAAAVKLQKAQDVLNKEVMAGTINADQMAAKMAVLKTRYASTINVGDRFGKTMKTSTGQVANLGAQLNDIGVMLAAGQNPLQLAVQQGTQINQVFAQMGGGKAALRGLAGGFMSMVNPMSLATIGIIAGGAALVQWGVAALKAGDDAVDFTEKLEMVREAQAALNEEIRGFNLGVSADELIVIDAINAKRKEILDLQKNITPQTRIQIEAEKKVLAELVNQRDEISRLEAIKARQKASADELADAERAIWSATKETGDAMDENTRIAEMLRSGIKASVIQAMALAGVDLSSNIDDAAMAAANLASQYGIAYSRALQLATLGQGGGGRGQDPRLFDGRDEFRKQLAAQDAWELPVPKGGGGGGRRRSSAGGGGGGGAADPYQSDIESLIESLRTERETVDAWYAESDALLNDRRTMELLGAQGHNEAKLALEAEYSARLVEIKQQEAQMVKSAASGMYGELSTLLSTFGAKSKAAATAALAVNTALRVSEVIQNTAAASVRALAELGPIAGPPAAAKIMAFGKVQAGLVLANAALSAGGSSGGGGGASAPSAGSTSAPAQQQRAIIQVSGGRSRFTIDEMNDIIAGLQNKSKNGVIIEGFTRA